MKTPTEPLAHIRDQLDAIDQQIQTLLNERATLATQVGNLKKQQDAPVFYRPEREAQILEKITQRNPGLLSNNAVMRIFRVILSECLALQHPTKVAYLGPEGTFSEMAAIKNFTACADLMGQATISDVFHAVQSDQANYGVVPIENSYSGIITTTMSLLQDSDVQVCGEVNIKVQQHLLRQTKDDTPLKRIYSHEQSLKQCENWLKKHYPNVELINVESNALAAQKASKEIGVAAIASLQAAKANQLIALENNIQDDPQNTTRFLVIGKQAIAPSGKDKTTLSIITSHKPGALLNLISPFSKHAINLSMIASKPYTKPNWQYIFLIEIEGHQIDENVKLAIKELSQQDLVVRVLGSYPKAN